MKIFIGTDHRGVDIQNKLYIYDGTVVDGNNVEYKIYFYIVFLLQ